MATKRYESLKKTFENQPTLVNLLDFLEVALFEKEYADIISAVENWKGPFTVDIDYYWGVALIESGHKKEGIAKLKSVIAVNKNHFKAKLKIDEYGESEEGDIKPQKQGITIKLPEVKIEETPSFQNEYKRKILLAVGLVIFIFIIFSIIKTAAKPPFEKEIEQPEIYLSSLNYEDFDRMLQKFRVFEEGHPNDINVKKIIFMLTAFAIIDYNLYSNQELMSQLSYYYGFLDSKENFIQSLFSFVQTQKTANPAFRKNQLIYFYPDSLSEIQKEKIEIPQVVTKENLRNSVIDALLLLRSGKFDESLTLAQKIISSFPNHEIAEKILILSELEKAFKSNKKLSDAKTAEIKSKLKAFKEKSRERRLLAESFILFGKSSDNSDFEKEGFFMDCPGRNFCKEIILNFLEKGLTEEAKNMAVFSKEKKGTERTDEDIKLVMITSKKDDDFGNCYFAFKELLQFFPEKADLESFKTGGFCAEKQNYTEEALSYYQKAASIAKTPEIEAKIYELNYLQTQDESSYLKLKSMIDKGTDSKEILNSYLSILQKRENLAETVSLLDKLYEKEEDDNKIEIIEKYLKNGAINQAVKKLKQNLDMPGYSYKLYTIYNQYLLFNLAENIDKTGDLKVKDKLSNLKQVYEKIANKDFDKALQIVETIESNLKSCSSTILITKAEIYRQKGDKNKTLSMIDALIECNRFFMPALILAAEISYYQNDIKRAEEAVDYLLKNENYFSPEDKIYHNYLVLMQGEIIVTKGGEKELLRFLKKNMDKSKPLSAKELEKLEDIYDKISPSVKSQVSSFINLFSKNL